MGNALLLVWIDRRFGLRGGRLFAAYLAIYTVGRSWIEALRDDHVNRILGLRVNDWMSLVVFLGAVTFLVARRGAESASDEPRASADVESAESTPSVQR